MRILEVTLEKAKNGELTALAVIYVKTNGNSGKGFTFGVNRSHQLLGAMLSCQKDILQFDEDKDD